MSPVSSEDMFVSCSAVIAFVRMLGVIIHFDTDHGEVIVEVDDPSLVVRISRNGQEMRILEQGDTRVTFLPSGRYDITVPDADHTVSVSPNRVQVSRGAKKFITIRMARNRNPLALQAILVADRSSRHLVRSSK